jgi:hypothetical protein
MHEINHVEKKLIKIKKDDKSGTRSMRPIAFMIPFKLCDHACMVTGEMAFSKLFFFKKAFHRQTSDLRKPFTFE